MSDTPHELQESRILRTELLWAFGVGIFVAASLSMIVFTALTIKINPPSNVERIDPKTLHLSGEFAEQNLGTTVFGDGTVVIKSTPGHTVGHQVLFVKLPKTGPIVLSGDLYHYSGERTLNRMPDREKTAGTPESRSKIEALVKETGAQLWIGHDIVGFAKLKKSPEYYE